MFARELRKNIIAAVLMLMAAFAVVAALHVIGAPL
jgi:hypothetical protein